MDNNTIKDFYGSYSDEIIKNRFRSTYPLRRYVHEAQYKSILCYVEPWMKVLDAGCGEGVLSVMMAKKGARVTGCDISRPNINSSSAYAKENDAHVEFMVSDLEKLPFEDASFDLVVSSHVLEHLPDFDKGLKEIMRVTKNRAVVAIPTLLNPCSLVQVGHGWFFLRGPRSFLGFFWGFLKMIFALISRKEGVDETYAGKDVPHIFRFPWVVREKAQKFGYSVIQQEASSICLPYFDFLLPATKYFDQYRNTPLFRNFGYGTTYILEKKRLSL